MYADGVCLYGLDLNKYVLRTASNILNPSKLFTLQRIRPNFISSHFGRRMPAIKKCKKNPMYFVSSNFVLRPSNSGAVSVVLNALCTANSNKCNFCGTEGLLAAVFIGWLTVSILPAAVARALSVTEDRELESKALLRHVQNARPRVLQGGPPTVPCLCHCALCTIAQ